LQELGSLNGARSAVPCTSMMPPFARQHEIGVGYRRRNPRRSRGRARGAFWWMPQDTAATWSRSGISLTAPQLLHVAEAEIERDIGAGDGGGARAAVGLQHVAIDLDLALAEPLRLVTVRKRAADQALDLLVRPDCLPFAASRSVRVWVERGSMPYSAVTQPWPELRRNGGTFSSIEAVHSTCVSPNFARHEPSAYLLTSISKLDGRISSAARPDGRMRIIP
jgi:hypothetical protein